MKLIKRVNLLDDKKLIMKLNILTIPLLVIFFCFIYAFNIRQKVIGRSHYRFNVSRYCHSINGRVNHRS